MPSPAEGTPSLVFAPDLGEPGAEFDLSPDESHYVARVCRLRIGDRLQATNGRGTLATLEVVSLATLSRVRVESRETHPRGRARAVWCGVPEGQRADWLVEKLAELGVAIWQPIDCERGSWSPTTQRLERWDRLAVAALRQSRRIHRMEIRPPIGLTQALAGRPRDARGWWADPKGGVGDPSLLTSGLSIGVIGPSQGLSRAEKTRLTEAGFEAMSLSDSRLRTETAALAWAIWSGLAAIGGTSGG